MTRVEVYFCLARGGVLAAAAPASDPARLAWVGVYALTATDPAAAEMVREVGITVFPVGARPVCRVRYFEVDRVHVARARFVRDHQLQNERSELTRGMVHLGATLSSFGVEIEALEPPEFWNYPLPTGSLT